MANGLSNSQLSEMLSGSAAEGCLDLNEIRPELGSEARPDDYLAQTVLDPTIKSSEVEQFENALRKRIIGQERAIRQLARIYQAYRVGLTPPGRPLANLLLLGPTGSGKTRLVEATGEVLFGKPQTVVKIDCAEFQHSHEISKLVGSPPGYVGHRETPATLTQETLDRHHTEKLKLSLVLFDEIEKASDALWQLLLGVLDKATLTLGDNRRVDFSHSIIFLTSNLGSSEIGKLLTGGLGYAPTPRTDNANLDEKIYRTAIEAARHKFSPEFMNRMDKVIVFRSLQREHLDRILDIELSQVQKRITSARASQNFMFQCLPGARDFLLEEGTDAKCGARHLKRAIERHLVSPLSCLLATGQIRYGDMVNVDCDLGASKLNFRKATRGIFIAAEMKRAHDAGWESVADERTWVDSRLQ